MNPDHIVAIVVAIFAVVSFSALDAWVKTPTFQDIVLKYAVEKKDINTKDKK